MLMGTITYLKARFGSKKGQGMVEYGLIIGIIAVLVVAAFVFLNQPIRDLFANVGEYVKGQGPEGAGAPTPAP